MKRRLRKYSVRNRLIAVSFSVAFLFFIFTTPIFSWVSSLVTPPSGLSNLNVIVTATTVNLSWDPVAEIDVADIVISFNENVYELGSSETKFSVDNQKSFTENITIQVRDRFGFNNTQEIDLSEQKDQDIVQVTFNEDDSAGRINRTVLSRSIIIGILIMLGTFAVLGFDFPSRKSKIISLYPTFVIVPYVFLSYSFLIGESLEFSKFLLSAIFSVLLLLITYFVTLTTNILNTSLEVKIPLEQAARASQFIFSLISSYLILILFFGVSFNFFEKIVLIIPPIFYLTFSAILMLENIKFQQAVVRSLSITFALIYGIFVLSIWPISYAYAILTIAIFFYILLSVALEIRPKVNKYVWLEYGVLIALVTMLLFINSSWGINGTLL